jgi:hypothetical protein
MTSELLAEFLKLLLPFGPQWVLLIVVCGILAYRSPLIIRECFEGARKLLNARGTKATRT